MPRHQRGSTARGRPQRARPAGPTAASSHRCRRKSRSGLTPNDPVYRIGVPVGVFPKWLRCPRCKLLSDVDSGVFTLKGTSTRPDEVQYVHKGCSKQGKGRAPTCVPARFVVACRAGHLDDFPWREFVHRGPTTCQGTLRFYEKGSSLETANLFVACDHGLGFSKQIEGEDEHPGGASGGCGLRPRSMVDAFGERARRVLSRSAEAGIPISVTPPTTAAVS